VPIVTGSKFENLFYAARCSPSGNARCPAAIGRALNISLLGRL
jgi:hypothetical protein